MKTVNFKIKRAYIILGSIILLLLCLCSFLLFTLFSKRDTPTASPSPAPYYQQLFYLDAAAIKAIQFTDNNRPPEPENRIRYTDPADIEQWVNYLNAFRYTHSKSSAPPVGIDGAGERYEIRLEFGLGGTKTISYSFHEQGITIRNSAMILSFYGDEVYFAPMIQAIKEDFAKNS